MNSVKHISESYEEQKSNLYDFSTGKLVKNNMSESYVEKRPPKQTNKTKGKKAEVYTLKIDDETKAKKIANSIPSSVKKIEINEHKSKEEKKSHKAKK